MVGQDRASAVQEIHKGCPELNLPLQRFPSDPVQSGQDGEVVISILGSESVQERPLAIGQVDGASDFHQNLGGALLNLNEQRIWNPPFDAGTLDPGQRLQLGLCCLEVCGEDIATQNRVGHRLELIRRGRGAA